MTQAKEKLVEIFVNTISKDEPHGKITFARLVSLAFGEAADPNAGYKITYERGEGNAEPKDLPVGGQVQIHEGMIFNVSPTAFS